MKQYLSLFSFFPLIAFASHPNFCSLIEAKFQNLQWKSPLCQNYTWNNVRKTKTGSSLVWHTFGEQNTSKNTTLVLCGVHGDEITPVKFCFDIMENLKNRPDFLKDKFIVIAPLVSPDSFFKKKPTRTNASGVDVNRNFPTKDWNALALKSWKQKYKSDKRRYPGPKALSEPETLFQMNLIIRYKPSKIISVHAPLTLLDYDGPDDLNDHNGKHGHELLIQMSEKAEGYKINDYPYYPGSLGNWAGNEMKIPTYTLELPSSDPSKSTVYFEKFKNALDQAFEKNFENPL